ncbi:OmpA family protein [Dyella amyloliquefaciens]|uniref:OmpA family protein n=1 Tax=Dyella amyloliquefaciens TaxID=1770545 RepID=UPI00102E4486|nr:OmpA family protein [Dyella amyloliquefaciens]
MRTIHVRKRLWPAFVAAAIAATTGCSTAPSHNSVGGPVFPDPSHAIKPEGTFVNVENLRKLAPGMSKDQLYELVGTPHFDEGVFHVRAWNYILDFRQTDGQAFQCQLQVKFGKNDLSEAYYWKPESCKDLLAVREPVVTPSSTPAPMTLTAVRLASDALFAFDSSTLTSQGKTNLDALLAQVKEASQIQNIMITGYTDRIGSQPYNLDLSRRRAEAVRNYLAGQGVLASAMLVDGRGEDDPLVQCTDKQREKLIACLAPNRRVELKGTMRTPT